VKLLVIPSLLLLGWPALNAAQHTGSVRAADQFLPGATVTATQGGAKVVTASDDLGRYAMDLTPGVWRVKVQMFGFVDAERDVEVPWEGAVSWHWTLEMKVREAEVSAEALEMMAASAPVATVAVPAIGATPGKQELAPLPAVVVAAAAAPQTKGKSGKNGAKASGFQSLSLNATPEGEAVKAAAAAAEPPPATEGGNAESFLVSGSVSTGLEESRRQEQRSSRTEAQDRGAGSFSGGAASPSLAALFGGGGDSGFPGEKGMSVGPKSPKIPARYTKSSSKGAAKRRLASFGNKKKDNDGLHGSLSFSLRNSALDARPYSLTGQTVNKPSYARNTFSASAGGPLRIPKIIDRDTTFVYFTYQGSRTRNPYNAVSTLATDLERAGDFSQSIARWPVQIYDPGNGQPFAGNIIPKSRFDSAAQGLLRFMPMPNQPGRVQNYQYITSYASNSDTYGGRVNQTLSRRDRVNVNFNLSKRDYVNPQVLGFRDSYDAGGMSASAGWSHTFAPRFLNSLNWNFSRSRNDILPHFAYTSNVADELGIAGTSDEPINFGPPNVSFTNFGSLADASATLRRDQTSSVSDSVTLVLKKKHNLGFGFEYRRQQINSRAYANARGSFSFSGLLTSAFDAKGNPLPGSGYDFADFLLGLPQSSSIRFGSENTYFRSTVYSTWVTDDWRVRPGLTVNAGVRYEYFTPFTEKFGHMANLDVHPYFLGVAVVTPGTSGPYTGEFGPGLVDPDKNNFSPRIGIAWRPFPRKAMHVRAGYGVFYNGSIYSNFPSRMASQPPFAKTASLSTSNARRLTLSDGFAAAPATTITNSFALNRFYKVGYAQTFNVAVQQGLPHALVVELGYQGTKGTRLDIQRLPNRAAPGNPLTAEQRRQIGNAVGFTYEDSNGNSILHSAQLRLTRRFQKNVSASALYTFGKSIDNVSTFGGGGTTVAQNDRDLHDERGLSSFDQRHQLSSSFVLTSPVGTGNILRNGGWRAKVLQDWTVSGSASFQTGIPLTARVLGNLANSGGTGAIGSGRADADPSASIFGGGYRFFNQAAFLIPPSGRYGNAGRNTIPGPSRFWISASAGRSFKLRDSARVIEARADTYNTANIASYTMLGTVINASNYGLPTSTLPMRSITFTLRYRF
jgi:trimeric autotransporter adhesin